jgi:hypothetical protein
MFITRAKRQVNLMLSNLKRPGFARGCGMYKIRRLSRET